MPAAIAQQHPCTVVGPIVMNVSDTSFMKCLPDNAWLLDEAGPGAFERGVGYYRQGRVHLIGGSDEQLFARVRGSEIYTLELTTDNGDWRWRCDCPAADGGAFCKHLVAAVLVARDDADGIATESPADEPAGSAREDGRAMQGEGLRAFLEAQSAGTLAGWLHELAMADRDIEQRLSLYRSAGRPDELKAVLAKLLNTGGFLDYGGAMRYARRLDAGIAQLREMLVCDPAACRELCEYAFKRLIKVYTRADDSAGAIGERLHDVAELHQGACVAAPPGKALARILHGMKCSEEWNLLPLQAYWDALGPDGQRDYTSRVLAQFDALPPPTQENRYGDAFQVCHRVEELAQCSGDFELMQRVLRRDLSGPYQHLRVFESLREAGREREALAWVEQAAKRFPGDSRLGAALAESLAEAGLHEEALEQAWQCFCTCPGEEAWWRLQRFAGPQDWPAWRNRALEFVASTERGVVHLRIELLRLDGDIDAALQLARSQQVSFGVLLDLARHVRRSHPPEAGALYLRAARFIAERLRGPGDYKELAHCLKEAASRLPLEEWQPFLADVREKHRRKRKLMEMLDAVVPG